ncbi:hypothetical protein Trydic_g16271 [Trypoxylus dichotomus]
MANLQVEIIYFYPLENAEKHHTENYELIHDEVAVTPVLRRGQKFNIAIRFTGRQYSSGIDSVSVIFNFGPNPNVVKGTKAIVRLKESKSFRPNGKTWTGAIVSQHADSLIAEICSAVDCPVGQWSVQVETAMANSVYDANIYDSGDTLYFLFNPWHKSDLVYMGDERLLDEYILNDVGKIWIGPKNSSRGREWVFGQFDGCVLPAIMFMLDMSQMPYQRRGDPIKLTRVISKMVNNNDEDNGIVVGRWDGDYIDGVAPSAWTGSVDILRKYLETKQSVCYGQCWVFAGVTATICRALGIPCRVVSNLVSAHDANSSLTIDRYYDENNEELDFDPMNEYGMDSIWNYHVWNDAWMARPDLPLGYGGWQAIDATPQEPSSGLYQCGPASLEAIKKGAVGFNFDVAFMVASVNADLMRWKRDPKSELGYSRVSCNKYHIGFMILTKKPWIFDPNGDQDREDITLQYKAKEGSPEERLSLYNAVRASPLAKTFYDLPDEKLEDIEFDLLDIDTIKIGQDFSVTVIVTNKCTNLRTMKLQLAAKSVFYNGTTAQQIDKTEGFFQLKPQTSDKLELNISADKYLNKLVEYSIIKIHAVATVEETLQTWADEDDFQVVKPTINIKISEEIYIKKPTPVTLRFTNPLKTTLTKCQFSISGSNSLRTQIIQHADVKPGGVLKAETQIVLRSPDLLVYLTDNSRSKGEELVISLPNFDYNHPIERVITLELSRTVRNNGSMLIHTVIIPSKNNKKDLSLYEAKNMQDSTYLPGTLTQYMIPKSATFNLLQETAKQTDVKPVTHIKTKYAIMMCNDELNIPHSDVPMELIGYLRINHKKEFSPILIHDFLRSRLRDLEEISLETKQTQFTFVYNPSSIGKFKYMIQMEITFNNFLMLGFTEKDVDEIKGVFADTNLYLLCATVFIGSVHLLLDFLSFKNDVSFWRSHKSMAGLSTRTVIWRAFSQTVIFLYLLDEGTSLLVLVPSGIATVIEFWKIKKVLKATISWNGISFNTAIKETEEEARTRQYDEESMRYLSYVLYPLCMLGAIYSLIYQPHKSWYSWTINSLVNGVYVFGFLFMLPQLFVNYRLKSVAALPWRAFTYRAFNTFIDDVFAFIITMPTAHRLACFRDDVVFLIYLYQRWLYPVDKTRTDEMGDSDTIEGLKNKKDN